MRSHHRRNIHRHRQDDQHDPGWASGVILVVVEIQLPQLALTLFGCVAQQVADLMNVTVLQLHSEAALHIDPSFNVRRDSRQSFHDRLVPSPTTHPRLASGSGLVGLTERSSRSSCFLNLLSEVYAHHDARNQIVDDKIPAP